MNNNEKQDSLTLEILDAIDNNSDLTQRHLAISMGVALGLANSYLKRCVRKGLVKIHQAPANRYLYYLTPKGFAEKSRLTARYLSSSFEFYRRAGDSCRAAFDLCRERGWSRIVLCGHSELAEIALLRAHDEPDIKIIGMYDPEHHEEQYFGLPVWMGYSEIREHDALLLTALDKPLEYLQTLNGSMKNHERILVPSILGLNKDALMR